ncbi:hypothetical protein [Cryobacterium sp. CG_9.6]|uniref:hypothetical protein n=1 Tax=Cryobacterium sp. CG_9.6 TaxID=2760710 RepID=UPI00247645A6|nr:hypothetical protein [Cryobacterium sp. CG_9.6]MDH6237378.1 hypothetical protein [Cryobacterium sp. CG_9.6]
MSFVTAVLASPLVTSAFSAEVEHVELPFPLLVYPAIAAVLFLGLGLVLWSFRDVANRHSAKAAAYARASGGAIGSGEH